MRHPMECHITDGPSDPEDRPEHEDEEVGDALTQDDSLRIRQREILKSITRTVDQLKHLPCARKQAS